jgi:hypothetical protein
MDRIPVLHRTTVHLRGRLIARFEGIEADCHDFARGFDAEWGQASRLLTGRDADPVQITVEEIPR